jgi:hypothetical protein
VISLQWFHMACCWQPAMPLSNEDSSVFVTRKHCHHESAYCLDRLVAQRSHVLCHHGQLHRQQPQAHPRPL